MKITNVETLIADGGWRPWIYVKIETDEGVTGYGECTDPRSPNGVAGTIKDLTPVLIGQDPGAYEMRAWDMFRAARQSPGGIVAKAIAGIDCALLDIKAKALGINDRSLRLWPLPPWPNNTSGMGFSTDSGVHMIQGTGPLPSLMTNWRSWTPASLIPSSIHSNVVIFNHLPILLNLHFWLAQSREYLGATSKCGLASTIYILHLDQPENIQFLSKLIRDCLLESLDCLNVLVRPLQSDPSGIER